MKINCLFVYIFIFLIIGSACYAAQETKFSNDRAAKKAAQTSAYNKTMVCNKIIYNFKKDPYFTRTINKFCMDSDESRYALKQSIYPLSNNNYEGWRDVYTSAYANFLIDFDKDQINILNKLVVNYCKYNSFRVRDKDPQACSPERIKSIFAN